MDATIQRLPFRHVLAAEVVIMIAMGLGYHSIISAAGRLLPDVHRPLVASVGSGLCPPRTRGFSRSSVCLVDGRAPLRLPIQFPFANLSFITVISSSSCSCEDLSIS